MRNDISGLLGFIGQDVVWHERLQDVVAEVLETRRRALRGQLHGSVLPTFEEDKNSNRGKLHKRIRNAPPRFSSIESEVLTAE